MGSYGVYAFIQTKYCIGLATGLIVGLAAVALAAGYIPVWASIVTGLLASPLSWFFITVIKSIFKYGTGSPHILRLRGLINLQAVINKDRKVNA